MIPGRQQCLRALSKLIIFRIQNFPTGLIKNKQREIKIIITEMDIKDMFAICFLPIWIMEKVIV